MLQIMQHLQRPSLCVVYILNPVVPKITFCSSISRDQDILRQLRPLPFGINLLHSPQETKNNVPIISLLRERRLKPYSQHALYCQLDITALACVPCLVTCLSLPSYTMLQLLLDLVSTALSVNFTTLGMP